MPSQSSKRAAKAAPAASAAITPASVTPATRSAATVRQGKPAAQPAELPEPAPATRAGKQGKAGKRSVEPATAATPPDAGGNTAQDELQQALSPRAVECMQAWKAALHAARQDHFLVTPLQELDKAVLTLAQKRRVPLPPMQPGSERAGAVWHSVSVHWLAC